MQPRQSLYVTPGALRNKYGISRDGIFVVIIIIIHVDTTRTQRFCLSGNDIQNNNDRSKHSFKKKTFVGRMNTHHVIPHILCVQESGV